MGVHILVVPEQAQLLLTNLDRATAKLRDQDLVAGLHAGCNALSVPVQRSGSDSDDFGLVEFLDGRLRQENTRCGLGLGLDALDENAVEERGNGADRLDGRLNCAECQYEAMLWELLRRYVRRCMYSMV